MSDWISVKDRLPGDRSDVLATYKDRAGSPEMVVAWYDEDVGGGYWAVGGAVLPYRVTHWMPLPEPPKEEEHEAD